MNLLHSKLPLFDLSDDFGEYIDEDEITRDYTDNEVTEISPAVLEMWADEPGTLIAYPPPQPKE